MLYFCKIIKISVCALRQRGNNCGSHNWELQVIMFLTDWCHIFQTNPSDFSETQLKSCFFLESKRCNMLQCYTTIHIDCMAHYKVIKNHAHTLSFVVTQYQVL